MAHLVVEPHHSLNSLEMEVPVVVLWRVRHICAHLEWLCCRARKGQESPCASHATSHLAEKLSSANAEQSFPAAAACLWMIV